MCGRFTLAVDVDDLSELLEPAQLGPGWLGEEVAAAYQKRYNVAPTQPVLAVTCEGAPRAEWLRWGLVPSWSPTLAAARPPINARLETAASLPSFREPWRRRRCVVLADGFYEWKPGPQGRTTPVYITRPDRRPFAMAALWDVWKGPRRAAGGGAMASGSRSGMGDAEASPEGSPAAELRSCALLTTAANPSLEGVHHRMPVLLPVERVGLWLRGDLSPGELAELFADAAAQPLAWHPVSTAVNRAVTDAPWLREPLCEAEGGAPGPCGAPGEVQAPGSVAAAAAATEPSRSGRRRGREGTTERQGVVELSLWDE